MNDLENKALFVLRVIMFIPMLAMYSLHCADFGNDDFSWSIYFDRLEEAINRYWDN